MLRWLRVGQALNLGVGLYVLSRLRLMAVRVDWAKVAVVVRAIEHISVYMIKLNILTGQNTIIADGAYERRCETVLKKRCAIILHDTVQKTVHGHLPRNWLGHLRITWA